MAHCDSLLEHADFIFGFVHELNELRCREAVLDNKSCSLFVTVSTDLVFISLYEKENAAVECEVVPDGTLCGAAADERSMCVSPEPERRLPFGDLLLL
jgi:hypothetical protein